MGNYIKIEGWHSVGITPKRESFRSTCPNCSAERKKKNDKCLNIHGNVGHCHHCNTSYVVTGNNEAFKTTYTAPRLNITDISDVNLEWLSNRGISQSTVKRYELFDSENGWIGFPQYYLGVICNVKYRKTQNKDYRLHQNARLSFFGMQLIDANTKELYITEGEIDALSIYEATNKIAVSIPNGASNLGFLDDVWDFVKHVDKFHLVVDTDVKGLELRDELSVRIGRDKCVYYEYLEGCKDINDVLMAYDVHAVRQCLDMPKEYPINGILTAENLYQDVYNEFVNGYPDTKKTGHSNLDELFTVLGGQLTTITGIPGHGKSEFVDELIYRLWKNYRDQTFYVSSEKPPKTHQRQIVEKIARCRIMDKWGNRQMTEAQFNESYELCLGYFYFYDPVQMDAKIDDILQASRRIQRRYGLNNIVIDPWNCLEDVRPNNVSETEWVSLVYSKLTKHAKLYNLHIFVIAHPKKMQKKANNHEVPTLYDISGSAHFYNKTDNGVTIYRNANQVEVHVQKIRFQEFVGKTGTCTFTFDMKTKDYKQSDVSFIDEPDF